MATSEIQQQPNVLAVVPGRTPKTEYAKRNAFILSILQTFCGGLSILFQVLSNISYSIIGTVFQAGFWIGSIFIIVGIVGMFSSKKNNHTGIIIAFMVLSIIAAVFAGILLCFSITGVILSLFVAKEYRNDVLDTTTQSLLLIISVTELTVAIISSAICCRAVCDCCNSRTYQGLVYFYPATVNDPNAPLSLNSQQLAVFASPRNVGLNIYPNTNSNEVGTNPQSAPPSYSQITPSNRKEDDNQFQYVNFN